MQEWYTNAEFAALGLPGFPNTQPGVEKWFKSRGYDDTYPHRVRQRQGRGGGIERHVALLPRPLQKLMHLRELAVAPAPDLAPIAAAVSAAAQLPEPVGTEAGEQRQAAKLTILAMWDVFRAQVPGSEEAARHRFAAMYTNGRIEGIPAWVRAALCTKDGKDKGFSAKTLQRWVAERDAGRLAKLGGAYGNRRGTGVLDTAEDGAVADFLAGAIVANPHWTADHLRDQVADRFGATLNTVSQKTGEMKAVPLPDHRTFQRWVSKWREDHQDALLRLTDPDKWKNKRRFSGKNMNHWVTRPNQLWEADASPADALVLDGRYAIYAVVDIAPRRMKVLVTKTPKTAAMLSLLRRCILDWGMPEILRTDNGSDFTSYEFKRALAALGIQHDIRNPFSPWEKGSVERAIGTLQRGVMPLLPGYIGHSVADRKAIEGRKEFAKRLGESEAKAFCVSLTHQEMQAAIDSWVENKYHHAPHAGLGGKTPFQALAAYTGPIRWIADERALDLLLAPIAGKDGIRTVTKTGIRADNATFIHPDMPIGEDVLCRHDPEDMGRLYVYTADGREFICVAECPERLGINPGEAVRAVREAQAVRMAEEIAPLQREIRNMKPRDAIDAVLRVAEAKASNVVALPKPTETHTTPALEAAADALAPSRGMEPAPLPEAAARHHAQLVAELASPKVAVLPESPKQKFARMWQMQQRMEAGEALPPEEARELLLYVGTAEYRAHKGLLEDFGPMYLQG